ncbi:MAG: hypothetical protein KDD99_24375, partial [Bacteroidetes bacterium]|nr:hypothetical protein [Bacteroidota bacterium]
MNISFTSSPAFILLILIIAGGLTWLMYKNTKELLPRTPRILLSVFRFVVLTLIGILLLQPLLNSQTKVIFPPIVAVLQDVSESLVIQKDSNFVREEYPGLLKQFSEGFDQDEYVLDMYGFGSELQPDLSPDSLTFEATGTNISQAVNSLQNLYQNQNLGAMVLISDGIVTAGSNPLYTIEGVKQPVYTVLLGDTTSQKDIKIKEVLFNEIAYLNNEMPIKVKVSSSGYDQANLKVTLSGGGKTFGTQNISLGRNKAEGEVNFLVKPEEVGLQQFIIRVSRMDNEITYLNNIRRIFINVLETRVKIALFGGSPHPDIGALRKAFDQDESYELTEFILKNPGTYYNDPKNYNLEDYDLFILHNFPNSGSDEAMVNKIAEVVKEKKTPVIFFVGIFTDLRSMRSLFEYMAITPKKKKKKSEEVIVNFNK